MMKLLIASIFVLVSSMSCNAQFSWTAQVSNTIDYIHDIDFATSNNNVGIYGTYDGEIAITADGGSSWSVEENLAEVNGDTQADLINGVYIDDSQNALVVTNGGYCYSSDDGGYNWIVSYFAGSEYFYCLEVSNGRTFIGGNDKVYFSDDFGGIWDSIDVPTGGSIQALSFIGDNGVLISNSKIFTTVNLGASWVEVSGIPQTNDMNDVEMTTSTTFFTVGNNGEVYGAENMGGDWSPVTSGVSNNLYKIEFGSSNNGVITGSNGIVLMTGSGGFDPWDVSLHGASASSPILALHVQNSNYAWFGNDASEIYAAPDPNFGLELLELMYPDTVCITGDFDISFRFTVTSGVAAYPEFQFLLGGESTFGAKIVYPGVVLTGDTINLPLTTSPTSSNIADSDNLVTLQAFNGNDLQISYIILPAPDSVIHLKSAEPHTVSGPHEFCPGDVINLEVTGGESYSWLAGVDNPFASTNIVIPIVNTNYLVTIEQEYCTITDTIFTSIGVFCDTADTDTIAVLVPVGAYAFSPNGDSVNDVFVLDFLDGTNNNVQIFNRWGDLVVEFEDYDNESTVWDGTFGGRMVPGGTYYFTVEYDTNMSSSGWVQVVE